MHRIPVSILTGFLGSGKTTVLNHLLKTPEMAGAAVIVNEFGAIGLDHELVERSSDDVILLASGCVCCGVRADLIDTLRSLFLKRVHGTVPEFDRVMIETTGVADPAPVLSMLMQDPLIAARYRLDGVITTVDAVCGAQTLDAHVEAARQVASADCLLLTKTDRLDGEVPVQLRERLSALNATARQIVVAHGVVDPANLSELAHRVTDLPAAGERMLDPRAASDGAHAAFRSLCITVDAPVMPATLASWLSALRALKNPNLLRMKGIVHLAGRASPVAIHAVRHIVAEPMELRLGAGEDRRSRIVLITAGANEQALRDLARVFDGPQSRYGRQ